MADEKKKKIDIEEPAAEEAAEQAAETEEAKAAEETAEEPETAEQEEAPAEEPEEEAEEPEAEEAAEDAGTEKKSTGGFFKKKPKKDKKDEQIEELTDRLQRQMAEFENFRRRSDKEKAGMYDMGIRDMAEKLLAVVDNFERGLAGAEEGDAFAEGMKMIYKQMMTIFSELGIEPIEAEGKEFDPNLHNAVMHVEDEEKGENEIVEVFQKGFMLGDKVIRFAMVKVAN